jgi:hypothetical protein
VYHPICEEQDASWTQLHCRVHWPLTAPSASTPRADPRGQASPSARGLAQYLWYEGYREQVERGGYYGSVPTVWAAVAGCDRIACGVPGDGGTMRFRFNVGDPVYRDVGEHAGTAGDGCH